MPTNRQEPTLPLVFFCNRCGPDIGDVKPLCDKCDKPLRIEVDTMRCTNSDCKRNRVSAKTKNQPMPKCPVCREGVSST